MTTRLSPRRRARRERTSEPSAPSLPADEGSSVALDLLQAELYRMIDEVARAGRADRRVLAGRFERAWERFKDAALARG